jgi:hypothetical protein
MDDWRPNAADRCDNCRAQAWVMTTINSTDLLWCVHHYATGEKKLVELATRIRDFRFMLDMP